MIYILFILSLFEKWSVKYDLKLDFSYELAITLILFVFIIVRVVTYDLKSIASFFILSTVVISTIVCLIGKSSFYLFLINQIIITGGISLFIYSYINRKKINHLRFIKINIVIILISLILYLISKYYFISTELFSYINNNGGYKYPFYSSSNFTLTFSEPSFAGCYLISIFIIFYSKLSEYKNNVLLFLISFSFLILIYISGSKFTLFIYFILLFFLVFYKSEIINSILDMVLVLAIPIIIILSLYLDLSNASPDFINGLPNDSKESFYTRFFFIFTRYSYLAHEPFGFLFNFNHPIIIEKINNYIKPYDITYLTELNSYKTNMLYLFPKDYISVLTYNYGLFSIPILLSFDIFIIFIIKSFKACYFTKILILNIILLVSVSINLTSISFLMLLPLFFKNKDNHA